MRVAIAGAGISGLTTAQRLLDAGHTVNLVSDRRPEDTTSAVAAAIWFPTRIEESDRVLGWAAETRRRFLELASQPRTGVFEREGIEVSIHDDIELPWWAEAVPSLRRLQREEIPVGWRSGMFARLPGADMPRYLGWLEDDAVSRGAVLTIRSLSELDELAADADCVVNCTGLGARELVGDSELVGVRGQVRWMRAVGIERFAVDHDAMTYIYPRNTDVVCGGTADEGVDALEIDPVTGDDILERCSRLVPQIASGQRMADRVGVRPCRSTVRLELDVLASGRPVVHNYGHGGAGVTVSWGCAGAVCDLVATL